MLQRLRNWLARWLLTYSVSLISPKPTLEGLTIMSILSRLAALEAATAANAQAIAAHGATIADFATTESVTALTDRVSSIETEVGTEDDKVADNGAAPPAVLSTLAPVTDQTL